MAATLLSSLSPSPLNSQCNAATSIPSSALSAHRHPSKKALPSLPAPLRLSTTTTRFPPRLRPPASSHLSETPFRTRDYEFCDSNAEVELRLDIGAQEIQSSRDIFVDADETSLLVRVKSNGSLLTLMDANCLFDKIKPSETIWYIDEDQLVVNLKKYDIDVKWPDAVESWESLTSGILQFLKGASIYVIGDSTEINRNVARELAAGLGYIPFDTSELLENYSHRSIDSWVVSEGADSVAEAEAAVLESLSSHVRAVVATLGGQHGAARRADKWRYLHAGFTIWLSKSEAADETSAKEEARMHMLNASLGYTNADVVVKVGGWDFNHSKVVAQACLSALKQLILSDKQLTGKKSLYIRLGCRGDWPNIKPPGWDPSSGVDPSPET